MIGIYEKDIFAALHMHWIYFESDKEVPECPTTRYPVLARCNRLVKILELNVTLLKAPIELD